MDSTSSETLIRYVVLREELKPVQIYSGESPGPLNAYWAGISHAVGPTLGRADVTECFVVNFYKRDGELLESLQFDTLDIALDQAHSIVGIDCDEWLKCNVSVPDSGRVSWSAVST